MPSFLLQEVKASADSQAFCPPVMGSEVVLYILLQELKAICAERQEESIDGHALSVLLLWAVKLYLLELKAIYTNLQEENTGGHALLCSPVIGSKVSDLQKLKTYTLRSKRKTEDSHTLFCPVMAVKSC